MPRGSSKRSPRFSSPPERVEPGRPSRPRRSGPASGSPGDTRSTHRQRTIVERCFNRLKQFRGIATRYEVIIVERDRIPSGARAIEFGARNHRCPSNQMFVSASRPLLDSVVRQQALASDRIEYVEGDQAECAADDHQGLFAGHRSGFDDRCAVARGARGRVRPSFETGRLALHGPSGARRDHEVTPTAMSDTGAVNAAPSPNRGPPIRQARFATAD